MKKKEKKNIEEQEKKFIVEINRICVQKCKLLFMLSTQLFILKH